MSDLRAEIVQDHIAERMLQMVTEGFYDNSRTALWMFEVMGREYGEMDQWSYDLRYEALPQTCTWSISIWEFVYGIEPDESLTLEQRRARILAQQLSHLPINPTRIEAMLSDITGATVTITENIAPYTFQVEIDSQGAMLFNQPAALRLLRQIKPSHLSFGMILTQEVTGEVIVGGMAETSVILEAWPGPSVLNTEGEVITGGAAQYAIHLEIQGG